MKQKPTTRTATKPGVIKSNTQNQNDIATDVIKKKRKRPDLTEMMTPHTEPGEISKMLGQALTISHWPKIDTDDPQQVSDRIDQYHMYCIQNDIKPDMSGMALALGTFRQTLWRWENGVESDKPQGVRDSIKRGREINETIMVAMMQNGKLNPVTAIFLLKNNHGYKDQQDVVITPNNPLAGDPENIREKYIESIPDDTSSEE